MISLALSPWCLTFSFTAVVALANTLIFSVFLLEAAFFISVSSSCIFRSTNAKAFLFLHSPGSSSIPASFKFAGFNMRALKAGAWSTLTVAKLAALKGVMAWIMPSAKSSCFSEPMNNVLTKPEKLSVATMIFFLSNFKTSTVKAWPG